MVALQSSKANVKPHETGFRGFLKHWIAHASFEANGVASVVVACHEPEIASDGCLVQNSELATRPGTERTGTDLI